MTTQVNHDLAIAVIAATTDSIQQATATTKNVQEPINRLCSEGGSHMFNKLLDGNYDLEKDYDKALDKDIREVLTEIIDKSPSKAVRDSAVSNFVKYCNRALQGIAKDYATKQAKLGKSGTVSYPAVGRKIEENVPTTNWKQKDLTFEPKLNKDKEITGAKIATPKGANTHGNEATAPKVSNKAELLLAIQTTCKELDIDLVEVAGDLLGMASDDKVTFKVTKSKVKASKVA